MHFTDVGLAEEDMFSVESESDANEEKSSGVIETCLQTAYPGSSERRFMCSQINQADPIASKLNNLILNGTIPKDHIFYRYLSDMLEMHLTQITNIIHMLFSFSPL